MTKKILPPDHVRQEFRNFSRYQKLGLWRYYDLAAIKLKPGLVEAEVGDKQMFERKFRYYGWKVLGLRGILFCGAWYQGLIDSAW